MKKTSMKLRKIIYYTLSGILFIVLFSVILFKITEIVRPKIDRGIDMIHSFYEIEPDSLDVLLVGSSHLYYGFSPNEFWNQYGVTSYVMASSAQRPAYSYYLIKEALKYQKPKVIVYETYGMTYDSPETSEGDLRKVVDSIRPGRARLEMINDICADMSLKDKMSFYFPLIKYHDRWSDLQERDFRPPLTFLRGAKLTLKTRRYPDLSGGRPEKIPVIPEAEEYFKKIVSLCEENNVPLVLAVIPITDYKEDKFNAYYGRNLSVEELAKEYDLPLLFYQKNGGLELDCSSDYLDWGHLNYYGQTKFTRALGSYLKDTFGLEDHKNDSSYASWEKQYQDYLEYLKEKSDEASDGSNILDTDTTLEETANE